MVLNYIVLLFRFLKKLRESILALIISAVTSVFAGLFLGNSTDILLLIPGLIIHIPVAIGMRGNIFAALGSRLGSALHLGSFTSLSMKNEVVRSNIFSTFTLTLILSVALGFITVAFASVFGLATVSLFTFISIAFISGFVSGIILLALTLIIAFASYKKGWDPDNITAPLITALGDFFTIPSIILAARIVTSLGEKSVITFAYLTIIAALLNIIFLAVQKVRRHSVQYRKIVFQSLMIIILAGILDGFAGTFVELNIQKIVALPVILVMLPAFLETGGNIGNVLAARLSTKLHLGTIETRISIRGEMGKEILGSMALAYIIFPVLGFLTYAVSLLFGVTGLNLASTVLLSVLGGFILHLMIIFFTMFTAILSFKYGLDPDNVTIPLLTSATDIVGVLALFAALGILAIL